MYSILIALFTPLIIFLIICGISYLSNKNYNFIKDGYNWENIGIITFFLVLITVLVTLMIPYQYHEEKTSYNLESLEDNQSISGHFFLGCGMINGEMKYSFYYEDKGYYKLEQLSPYNTKIKYVTGRPKLIVYSKAITDNLHNKFLWGCGVHVGESCYVICVPKGTIKNNYYLDTK